MIDRDVMLAFDMLMAELDAIVTDLNQQGAQLMQAKNYAQAREVIAKAEGVLAFQAKVKALQDDWVHMAVPPMQKTPKVKKPVKRTLTKMLNKGLRTPNDAFRMPILQTLVQMGGSGRVSEVLDRVGELMEDQLNKYDYESIPSNPNELRWRNNAQWARLKLVQEGYMASDSPRGVWEITDEGRKLINTNANKISEQQTIYFPEKVDYQDQKTNNHFKMKHRYHRQSELHDRFGGNRQSGIAVCAEYPIIFLFTSPSGDEFGYQDGWRSETEYVYTGEGQFGDMEMKRGNSAIRDHFDDDRELHLFNKVSSGIYEYLGQFKYQTHEMVSGKDVENQTRNVIRFVLEKL